MNVDRPRDGSDGNSEARGPIRRNRSSATGPRRRWSRSAPVRAGLAALAVGLTLLLSACANGTGGQAPGPDGAGSRNAAETAPARTGGNGAAAGKANGENDAGSEQATVSYRVPTITCPSCVARVEASAEKEPGVVDAKASLETQEVTVDYDPAKTTPEKIAGAIREGGDTVERLDGK